MIETTRKPRITIAISTSDLSLASRYEYLHTKHNLTHETIYRRGLEELEKELKINSTLIPD